MTLEYLKSKVERETGIADISIINQEKKYVIARSVYCELAKRFTSCTLKEIGDVIMKSEAAVHTYLKNLDNHLAHEKEFSRIRNILVSEIKEENKRAMKPPKERAAELLDMVKSRAYSIEGARQLAIIIVDEILKEDYIIYSVHNHYSRNQYWKEVKQHLETL